MILRLTVVAVAFVAAACTFKMQINEPGMFRGLCFEDQGQIMCRGQVYEVDFEFAQYAQFVTASVIEKETGKILASTETDEGGFFVLRFQKSEKELYLRVHQKSMFGQCGQDKKPVCEGDICPVDEKIVLTGLGRHLPFVLRNIEIGCE